MTYSLEIRHSVIKYYNMHRHSHRRKYVTNIMHIFNICKSTFYNWLNLYHNTSLAIKKQWFFFIKKSSGPKNSGVMNELIEKYIIDKMTNIKKPEMKNLRRLMIFFLQKKNHIYKTDF